MKDTLISGSSQRTEDSLKIISLTRLCSFIKVRSLQSLHSSHPILLFLGLISCPCSLMSSLALPTLIHKQVGLVTEQGEWNFFHMFTGSLMYKVSGISHVYWESDVSYISILSTNQNQSWLKVW